MWLRALLLRQLQRFCLTSCPRFGHQPKQGSNQSTSETSDAVSWARGPEILRSGTGLPRFPHLCPGELFWLSLVFEVIFRIKKGLSHLQQYGWTLRTLC